MSSLTPDTYRIEMGSGFSSVSRLVSVSLSLGPGSPEKQLKDVRHPFFLETSSKTSRQPPFSCRLDSQGRVRCYYFLTPYIINLMVGLILLRCSRNSCFIPFLMIQNRSSTYLHQRCGLDVAEFKASPSTTAETGDSIAAPSYCWFTLVAEVDGSLAHFKQLCNPVRRE